MSYIKIFILFGGILFFSFIQTDKLHAADKIGTVCDVEDTGGAYILHENESEEKNLRNDEYLLYEDKIRTKQNDSLKLLFPHTVCDKLTRNERITLWVHGKAKIELKKTSAEKIKPFIDDGTVHCKINHSQNNYHEVKKGQKLYVEIDTIETKRISIALIASDFLIIETEEFTIVMINNQVTKLKVRHIRCGGVHTLNAMGEYKFTDDCEIFYQKRTEKEINQILHELDIIPPDALKDENTAEQEMSDVQEQINDEQNENMTEEYKPQFPSRPPERVPIRYNLFDKKSWKNNKP